MVRSAYVPLSISPTDLAWVTGIYEGEGSLSQQRTTKHGYWVINVTMTDEDIVRRLYTVVGRGSFLGPMQSPSLAAYQPTFRWVVNAQEDIRAVTDAMYPMLGKRRSARVDEFRAWFESKKATRTCRNDLHPRPEGGRCPECAAAQTARMIENRALRVGGQR